MSIDPGERPRTALQVGDLLVGRYRLIAELGRGMSGVTYEACDERLNEAVALKLLSESAGPSLAQRFRREVQVARRLAHPNIVRLFDLHESEGRMFLTMELLPGESLNALLVREGTIPQRRAVALMLQLAEAVEAAHVEGVLHRDIKPDNIIVQPGDHLTVVDFGLATAAFVEPLTRAGAVMGTGPYMAPEIWAGAPATRASDVFAIGIVLYQCLTGKRPWNGKGAQVPMLMSSLPPVPPSLVADVHQGLDSIVLAAIATDPKKRTPHAADLANALALWLADSSLPPTEPIVHQARDDVKTTPLTNQRADRSIDDLPSVSAIESSARDVTVATYLVEEDEGTYIEATTLAMPTQHGRSRLALGLLAAVACGVIALLAMMWPESSPSAARVTRAEPAAAPAATAPTQRAAPLPDVENETRAISDLPAPETSSTASSKASSPALHPPLNEDVARTKEKIQAPVALDAPKKRRASADRGSQPVVEEERRPAEPAPSDAPVTRQRIEAKLALLATRSRGTSDPSINALSRDIARALARGDLVAADRLLDDALERGKEVR